MLAHDGRDVRFSREIHDIELGAHEQLNAEALRADDAEIAEIHIGAGAGHLGRVLTEAHEPQSLGPSGCNHFAQRAVGMAARNRVHVYIE